MGRPDEVAVQDNSAAYYEKRYSGYGLKYHKFIIDWMMEEVFYDQTVLDAGCGTGIIQRLYPFHYIVGFDISQEMINRYPKHHATYPTQDGFNVYHFRRSTLGDACNIYLHDDQVFDAVVCRSLLHHLPDHKKALKEFHRVLKPGGKLVAWETNKGWLAQKVREKTQHGDRFSAYHHSFTAKELVHDLQEAGFKVTELRFMGYLAYPLFGFPDIMDLSRWVPFKQLIFPLLIALDDVISWIPGIRRMAWAIGIKAVKV